MNIDKKYILGLVLIVCSYCQTTVFGQLTGSKHIPGDYATITLAVTAVNTLGVGTGGVTFNVAAGYTETISATISLTATGTAANPIIFQKNGAGNNPLITAHTTGVGTPASAVQDGIWRLQGSDYVTIDGIDLRDNPANTTNPSTMEYGYALYKASTSNGCQYVTIKNCTITLNTINNATGTAPMVDGSSGIIMMNALATAAVSGLTSIAGGQNSNNAFYSNTIQNCNTGIALIGYAAASPFTLADTNNDIGGSSLSTGNTILNYGGATGAANPAAGIRTLAQYGINISYNTINNNNGSGVNHPTTLRGILNNTAITANATITYNTITVNGGGTTQNILGIENVAGSTPSGNTINISNNTITNCTYTTATTGALYGIYNTGAPATLTINSNTFSGNATSATSGLCYAIFNAGAATTAININSNNIGTGLANAITFNAANSGAQLFINNTAGTAAAALSISNNNFQGINYATAGTGTNTYISNTAATLSQAINNNTFTNLSVNTTGNITFIANSVAVSATGTQNVNGNSISGTFTKATGGTLTLFSNAASSVSGSVINNNNNNFSNITVTGATIIAGWTNTDAGASTKNIQNNTFSNWTGGTGAITAMAVNITGTNNATSGNNINTISSSGAITGIATAAGNDNIYGNTINTLSTTGASAVIGISITAGTLKNIYRNKIYDLQANNASGTAYGISVSGTTGAVVTANIYNNVIGDLRAPVASAADPVRGISVTSTRANSSIDVYYNTIWLNAISTGTNFGTTGVYHSGNATATTATLDLRNNIIINTSTANGTGLTVAYRRSSTNIANYATTSNNNLFYSGAPSTTRLIFYDGTNSDQTLTSFKTRVSTRETASVTEDMITGNKFLSTSGASSSFLRIDPAKPTLAESGAANITNFTDDVDAQTRQGNIGYAGTGTAPDIGADEMDGIQATGLTGIYNVGAGQTYPSLTGAGGLFASINSLGLANNITVRVTSDLTEDGSNVLYAWAEQGTGNYTVTINPDATTTRTIAGDVVSGLIRFNGADRVTIDGGSGKYLTFRNNNTAGTTGTAFTFINGASNNTIQSCNIEAYANATNGVILFSTSVGIAGGNSSNTISNCTINATVGSNTSNLCIYSAGTTGNENSTNTISNNNISNYRDRAIDITATGSTAWTISGNSIYNGDVTGSINYAAASTLHGIRILGGAGYSILNNYIGGNAALASGTNASYSSTLGNVAWQGILLTTTNATPASAIKGNTIAGITISSVPTAATSNAFIGIETNGSGITIGGSSAGEGNTIGSNTINGSIDITTTTGTATYTTLIRGISCNSSGGVIIGNQAGGITIKNIGAAPAPSTFLGIYVNNANAPSQVNNNSIGSNGVSAATNSINVPSTSTAVRTALTGISIGSSVTSAIQIDANVIQNLSHQSTATSLTTGGITGISTAAAGTAAISITNNTIATNYMASYTTGTFYGIYNSGAAASVTINNNTIAGSSTASASGVYYAIYNAGAVTSAITINNNTIGNSSSDALTFNAANSGAQILIYNAAGTAAATLSISNNSLQGVTYAVASTGANTYISNTAATALQTIDGNTFTNFNANTTGAIICITNSVATAAICSTSGNTINSITGNGAVTGIVTGVGSTTVASNTIGSLSSTGTGAVVTGISVSGGALKNIYRNKIYDLQSNNATGTVNGILVSGSTIVAINIYNNLIGDLRTPITSNVDAIRGISVTATATNAAVDVYYNTVYLNAGSTGTNFGTTGIYHTTSATATTAALDLRNNIISNTSTPNGTGRTVAYRRSNTTLTNYTSTSNNNLLYAGVPSATKLIFYNGTNSDQTLTAFKTRVTNREAQSVTEDLSSRFLSTSGASADFLHITTAVKTIVESNAVNISGFTDDFDGQTRHGNSGYAGTGTSPDMGACEFEGIINNDKIWAGATSTDWNTASNWLYGYVPAANNNITIPGSVTYYPVLSSGGFTVHDLEIQTGGSLTQNSSLQISGAITNNGTFTATSGTIEMNGTDAQTIPSGAFNGAVNNLTITNNAGVTVTGTLSISGTLKVNSGTLNTGGFLTLLSTATQTAQIDGSGAGQVSGNVMMQRYLPSGFGYKYISSPFQSSTVNELSDDIDLAASFPTLYKFDESLTNAGYVSYTNTSNTLTPLQGYAANFGSSATPKTITVSGVVNNGPLSSGTLYNNNNEFTQGFNLIGNPYPSSIDWDAAGGWVRTNIDNALYFFNAGSTDQYSGTYSSYINGVSSDGVASNIIPSMQGFFIHVTNGTYPVAGSFTINNNARVTNLSIALQSTVIITPRRLLRLEAAFETDKAPADPTVIYFNEDATPGFDKAYDALKIMNSHSLVPSLYSIASDASKLSVAASKYQTTIDKRIPLGLRTQKEGWITFTLRDVENIPDSIHIYLLDEVTHHQQELRTDGAYRVYMTEGKSESRFSLVFSAKEIVNNPSQQSTFTAYSSYGRLYINLSTEKADVIISNTMGQVISRQSINGSGTQEITSPPASGMYIISLISGKNLQSKKIFINK